MSYLNETGLAYFWSKIKAWANSVFALLGHTHPSSDVTAMTGYSMPSSTGAISSGDTLNQAVGKLEKAIDAADISNVVHRTGNETVQGVKTFSNAHRWGTNGPDALSSIEIKHQELERNVAPAGYSRFAGIIILDKNAVSDLDCINRLAALEFGKNTDSTSYTYLKTYNPNSTDGEVSSLTVGWDANGIPYALAPSTSNSRNNGQDIVTRDWIPNDSRIVHTTGNETISGTKTFNDRVYIKSQQLAAVYYQYTSFSIPSLPSENKYIGTRIADNSGRILLDCYHRIVANGDQASVWGLHNTKATDADKQFVYQYIADGDKFYLAGPADFDYTDDSTKIPNTAWLRRATGNFALNAATATKAINDSAGNNISNTYVNKTGDTMSGNLRFVQTNAGVTHECLITMNSDSLNFGLYDYTNSHWILISNADRSWSMFYGDITGTAAAATQLATARTIRTNLASTSTASFDGSANIAPGVTGTLPVANGGTGLTSLDTFVRTTGNQTISGEKKFTTSPVVERVNPYLFLRETDVDRTTNSAGYSALVFQDKNSVGTGDLICVQEAASASPNIPTNAIELRCFAHGATNNYRYIGFIHEGATDVWSFQTRGGVNNVRLGNGGNRFSQLYAMTATIDTSDERMKSDIQSIPKEVLDAWDDIEWYTFKMNDAVAEKGIDKARIHSGLVAQRIASVFDKHSIDAFKYSFICYDSWNAKPAMYDSEGNLVSPEEKAGDAYSLRYVEALCIEAAYQRRENARLKRRVADLEERLAALELRLGSE